MAKTVTMKKGGIYADIFDSPETIAQAQKEGYHLCEDEEIEAREALLKSQTKKKSAKDDKPDGKSIEGEPLKSFADMDIKELLKFAKQRKIDEPSFKNLEKEPLIGKIVGTLRGIIAEKKLKTAEEAAALPEADLIALFDTIGK